MLPGGAGQRATERPPGIVAPALQRRRGAWPDGGCSAGGVTRKLMAVEAQIDHVQHVDFSILESVPDAMVIAHRDGRIVFVNSVAEKLFGWSRDEVAGHPIEILLP